MTKHINDSKLFSNYVDILPYRDRFAAYNKINGELILLDPCNIMNQQDRWLCVSHDENMIDYLENHLFFACDEYVQALIKENDYPIEDYNNVQLVISVTELCNCRCLYCYQLNWMHEDAILELEYTNWVISYIKNIVAKASNGGCITIKYFGGEPLLRIDLIGKFNQEIESIITSSKKNISVRYEIDTNCTLLTRHVLEQFDNLSIATTLTLPDDHDSLRSNTFQQVMNNLMSVSDLLELPQYQLNIGYNMHHNNITDFRAFLAFIKDSKLKCHIYVTNVVNYKNTHFTNRLSDSDFERIYCNEIIPLLLEYGYHVAILPPYGLHRKCDGINIVNKKFYSNGTQVLCSAIPKKCSRQPDDYPSPVIPTVGLNSLPEKCIKCYDFPYCGGERPCIKCDGHYVQHKAMLNRIHLFLDMKNKE